METLQIISLALAIAALCLAFLSLNYIHKAALWKAEFIKVRYPDSTTGIES